DAGLVGAEVVGPGLKTQRRRNAAELRSCMAVEEALGLSVVGDGLSKIEGTRCPGHKGDSESGRTIPGARSRRTPGSPEVPALLSLSCLGLDGAPPRDAHLACGVGEPQQQ